MRTANWACGSGSDRTPARYRRPSARARTRSCSLATLNGGRRVTACGWCPRPCCLPFPCCLLFMLFACANTEDKYRFCYKLVPFLRRTFLRIFCVFLSILSAFGPKGCIQFMHLTTHFCASVRRSRGAPEGSGPIWSDLTRSACRAFGFWASMATPSHSCAWVTPRAPRRGPRGRAARAAARAHRERRRARARAENNVFVVWSFTTTGPAAAGQKFKPLAFDWRRAPA